MNRRNESGIEMPHSKKRVLHTHSRWTTRFPMLHLNGVLCSTLAEQVAGCDMETTETCHMVFFHGTKKTESTGQEV